MPPFPRLTSALTTALVLLLLAGAAPAEDMTAVRALAFKWQRIMFVCWRDRVTYDEATYLEALKRRGSPLAAKLPLTLAQAA